MSDKPGFRFTRVKKGLLGSNPKDWRSYVEVWTPSIPDSGEVVSLGDRYILSLGAHATHSTLLMDRCAPDPLTVERCMSCCALLTFATDSAVVAVPRPGRLNAQNIRQFTTTMHNTVFTSVSKYGEKLVDLAEAAEVYTQAGLAPPQRVTRLLVLKYPKSGFWIYYAWPPSEAIFRALAAYWLGTLSIVAPSRILNFWRAVEAVTTRDERLSIFANLHSAKVAPVWTETIRIPVPKHRRRRIDANRPLRRLALRRSNELVAKYRSPKKALDNMYWETRGKAAHADKKSLEYDMASFIGDQLRDAELLRYMARVAIEKAWQKAAH
jgi:hypothetical protein